MTKILRWFVAWDRQLIEMANAGSSSGDVAKVLTDKWARPFSRSAVLARARRLNVCFRSHQAVGSHRGGRRKAEYSAEQIAAVRSLIEGGTPMRSVADETGLTLSAVRRIAKVHEIKAKRVRLPPRISPRLGFVFGSSPARMPVTPDQASDRRWMPLACIPERSIERATAVPFLDRRDGQCAFPLWSKGERIGNVCGAETLPGESWCPDCRRIVFGRVSSMEVAA